jgi:hypothetical protein
MGELKRICVPGGGGAHSCLKGAHRLVRVHEGRIQVPQGHAPD